MSFDTISNAMMIYKQEVELNKDSYNETNRIYDLNENQTNSEIFDDINLESASVNKQKSYTNIEKTNRNSPSTEISKAKQRLISTDNTESDVIMSGLLWKRSRNRSFFSRVMGFKNWKERKFVLKKNGELYYFKPDEEMLFQAKGKLLVNDAVVKTISAEDSFGKTNAFEIKTASQETVLLASDDPKTASSWIKIIEEMGNN
jgi:hypothetical protein